MKVTKVTATSHNIPLELPLGKRIEESFIAVRVETDEGITGFGMGQHWMRFANKDFLNRELGPFVVGKNPLDTERIWNKDAYAELGLGRMAFSDGLVRWGFSAIDIALWDIRGKYLNQPIFRLLGGNSNRIPAYVTCGFFMYTPEELTEVARYFGKMGQKNLKMQVAYSKGPDMDEEETRVRAMREGIGKDGMLLLDGNNRFTFLQAREFISRLEPYHIAWMESPVNLNTDLALMKTLKQFTRIPIANSGSFPGRRWLYRDLITSGAVDIINPNVLHCGGYTEGLKIALTAQSFGLPVSNAGGQPHFNMHLVAGVSNGWMVEFHYGHTLRDNVIFVNPPLFDHGFLTLPEKPGLGLEVNEAALKEYQDP